MPPCCMISGRHSWLLAMAARRFTPSVMSSTVPASVARVSAAERMALRIAGMPWAWYLGWDKKRIDTNSKVIQASSRFPRSGCFCDYRFTMIYPWKKTKNKLSSSPGYSPDWMEVLLAHNVARHFSPSAWTWGFPACPCMTLRSIGMMPASTRASLQPSCFANSLIIPAIISPSHRRVFSWGLKIKT